MTRRARADDVHEIRLSLPEAELGTSWGDRPTLPCLTIDHFDGYNAVLVQRSRLGEVDRDGLAEIITDAWAARAPRALAKNLLQHG